jgi:hypothetical protein
VSQVSTAAGLDWNVVAAAVAVFLGTLITTVFGWYKGRERIQRRLQPVDQGGTAMISGAVLQDNQSLRESTLVARDLRDQLLLTQQSMDHHANCLQDNTRQLADLVEELRRARFQADRQEKA